MDQITAIATNSQPTASAEIVISSAVEEKDIGHLYHMLTDHLMIGGRRLTADTRFDQFMLIAWHSPTTNVITIEWATPPEIIEDGERLTPAEAYAMTHPTKRAGYYEWQLQDYLDDDEDDED